MEINIGEVNSTMRAVDSASQITHEETERIVQRVLARLDEEQSRRRRTDRELLLTTPLADDPDMPHA
jgi:hypothetical protein